MAIIDLTEVPDSGPHRFSSCDEHCWGECWDTVDNDERDLLDMYDLED